MDFTSEIIDICDEVILSSYVSEEMINHLVLSTFQISEDHSMLDWSPKKMASFIKQNIFTVEDSKVDNIHFCLVEMMVLELELNLVPIQ